jgi:hypothetical protein
MRRFGVSLKKFIVNHAFMQTMHRKIDRHHEKFSDRDQNDALEVLLTLLGVLNEDFKTFPRAHGCLHPPGSSRIELHEFCHTFIITKLLHGCSHTQI